MSFSRRSLLTRYLPVALTAPLVSRHASATNEGEDQVFRHGIASGDPLQHSVILWTRISQHEKRINVEWQISDSSEFRTLLHQGNVNTSSKNDYTVKVDVTGLQPATHYYYRFKVGDAVSETGRTKTLPVGDVEAIKLGLVSCANYSFGYFNAYRHLAGQDDLDAIVHLGDYLYEYQDGGYDSKYAEAMGRVAFPRHEVISLTDYRGRHAQYKSDTDLQTLHARYPFITSWDDHEIANDSWRDGAENHSETEGSWSKRKRAAVQAYYEWMPIRESANTSEQCNYRSFQFGNLATLVMLETRICGRDQALSYETDLPLQERSFDFSDSRNPRLIDPTDPVQVGKNINSIPIPFNINGEQPVAITDYASIKSLDAENLPPGIAFLPDTARFETEILGNRNREMLGSRQEAWLVEELKASKRAGIPWQLIGNQTIMANVSAPDFNDVFSQQEIDALSPAAKSFARFANYALPYNIDAWDGYSAARLRVLEAFLDYANNTVVLSGDTHNAWANELNYGDENYCVEVGVPSVTSPGASEALDIDAGKFARMMRSRNAHVRYTNTGDRGYVVLTLNARQMQSDFYFVDSVVTTQSQVRLEKSVRLDATRGTGTGPLQV